MLEDADAVINLAGAPIAKRWTAAHKREMWNSRIRSTRTLVEAMKSVPRMPATLLNASAVGIYGARGDEPLTEDSAARLGLSRLARPRMGEGGARRGAADARRPAAHRHRARQRTAARCR